MCLSICLLMLPHAMLFDYELVNFRVQLNKVTLEYIYQRRRVNACILFKFQIIVVNYASYVNAPLSVFLAQLSEGRISLNICVGALVCVP
jgi:hypothetical protein